MNAPADVSCQGCYNAVVLPSQYNDLVRRRASVLDGEYRLLWAVLDDAMRIYLANMDRSTRNWRVAFEEVRSWLRPAGHKPRGLSPFKPSATCLESTLACCCRASNAFALAACRRDVIGFCATLEPDLWPVKRPGVQIGGRAYRGIAILAKGKKPGASGYESGNFRRA